MTYSIPYDRNEVRWRSSSWLRHGALRLKLTVMHLDRVVNGKIVEHRGLANEVDFIHQLEIQLVPKKGGT